MLFSLVVGVSGAGLSVDCILCTRHCAYTGCCFESKASPLVLTRIRECPSAPPHQIRLLLCSWFVLFALHAL